MTANDNQDTGNAGQRFITGQGSDRLLNIQQVCDRVSLSRATIYRLQLSGEFPARIKVTPGSSRYSERAVAAWIAGKMNAQNLAA